MKTARAKHAKILFFIVKYANLWVFCCRRRRGCLSFLIGESLFTLFASLTYAYQARFRRRSTHVPNLFDGLSPAKERRLNQFGTAILIRCGNVVKFDKVCRIIIIRSIAK